MGIGTSLGAFHEDEFAHIASPWMEKPEDTPDNNVIDSTVDPESTQPITNLVMPISDIKTSTGVTITDEDIDKGMGLALAFSGGGLSTTKGVFKSNSLMSDKISHGDITITRNRKLQDDADFKFRYGDDAHALDFENVNGLKGSMIIHEENGGKNLDVHWIGGEAGRASLGTSNVRDIIKAIQKEFPEATSLGGLRVSGARAVSQKAEIKLK